jgi:hypothetical protein
MKKNDKSVMTKCETNENIFFFRNILSIFFKILDRLFEIPQKHIKCYYTLENNA